MSSSPLNIQIQSKRHLMTATAEDVCELILPKWDEIEIKNHIPTRTSCTSILKKEKAEKLLEQNYSVKLYAKKK